MKYLVVAFALFLATACASDFESVESVVAALAEHDIEDCFKYSESKNLAPRGYFYSEHHRLRMDCTLIGNKDGMPDPGGYQKLLIDVLKKGSNAESVCQQNPDCSRGYKLSLVSPDSEYKSDTTRHIASMRDLWVFDNNAIIRVRTSDGDGMVYENRTNLHETLKDDLASRSSGSE
ncbi:uncharacterized protein METZ01_LOCUS402630 [marine metagenome]|uniref:Uncharacterized protein n=1 Tax=marine metagenome TaxID=408172 RepID=A0A382VT53_9ZZZZ